MNKTIRDIERESGIDVYSLGLDRSKWEAKLVSYTEMIVRECADIALREDHDPSDCILKHFGVER